MKLSIFKQLAKKHKKATGVKHSRALHETALALGFNNYKHYLNTLKDNNEICTNVTRNLLPRKTT